MEKKLIKNAQEIIDLLEPHYSSVEDLEYDLGIAFAYESDPSSFAADYQFGGIKWREEDPHDGEEVTFRVWRPRVDCMLPNSYPVLMVYYLENSSKFDRFCDMNVRIYEFVTLDDFRE